MNKSELICRYLNGELGPGEERKALHTIADDEDLRSMLRFEQKLNSVFQDYRSNTVPEGFTEDVMHLISEKEEAVNREFVVMNWFKKLWTPRQLQWRPVYAVAAVILVIGLFSYPAHQMKDAEQGFSGSINLERSAQKVSSSASEVLLRFVYIDENANSVAVAGDFSHWEPIKLSKRVVNGKQIWTGLVPMSRGEHSYMFVKNGTKWVTDPLAMVQREDGFGNKNAVIYL